MELWEMTPKQFYKYWINKIYQECNTKDNPLTKREIIEYYPFKSVNRDIYLPLLLDATKENFRIPDKILDKLTPEERYRFLHDYPDLYRGYLPPEIRKQKKRNI